MGTVSRELLEGDGPRGAAGVAFAAAGGGVSDRVFRRAAGEDPGGGFGSEQGGAPGDRGDGAGAEGDPGDVAAANEGAKFWLGVMNELKARGVRDRVDRGGGRAEGVSGGAEAAFPEATVQTCVVHLIRYSLAHASWKERKELASALRPMLPGGHAGGGGGGAGRVRGGCLGPEVPGDRAELAAELGAGDPVLRVFGADPAGDLHDERHREPEQHGAAGGTDAGPLSERPGGGEADLPDAAEDRAEVAAAADPGSRRGPSSPSCSGTDSRWRSCESASRHPAGSRKRRLEPVESAVPGKSRCPWRPDRGPLRLERFPQDLENAGSIARCCHDPGSGTRFPPFPQALLGAWSWRGLAHGEPRASPLSLNPKTPGDPPPSGPVGRPARSPSARSYNAGKKPSPVSKVTGLHTEFLTVLAEPVIAPSSGQQTPLSHPVPEPDPDSVIAAGYRTQFRPADSVIAPSSGQPSRLSHPVPASRPGYRTQFRPADPVIAPSSEQQTRLSHPVPASRPGYRTQFRAADPVRT